MNLIILFHDKPSVNLSLYLGSGSLVGWFQLLLNHAKKCEYLMQRVIFLTRGMSCKNLLWVMMSQNCFDAFVVTEVTVQSLWTGITGNSHNFRPYWIGLVFVIFPILLCYMSPSHSMLHHHHRHHSWYIMSSSSLSSF